jgi:hypothetical protein
MNNLELNQAVAIKIMGWTKLDGDCLTKPPDYSGDVGLAWSIFLKIVNNSFEIRRQFYSELQMIAIESAGGDCLISWPDVLTVLGEKMSEAICQAALRITPLR